jgi:hypothetical protein
MLNSPVVVVMKIILVSVAIMLAVVPETGAQVTSSQATADLNAALANQSSIESEIKAATTALSAAIEHLVRQQQLFASGLIARRAVEEADQAVSHQQLRLDLLNQRKELTDRQVALAQESLRLARQLETQPRFPRVKRVTRHYGWGLWSQRDFMDLARAFRRQFGRTLPISAFGQTRTHERLGLNHIRRMDIAVHPDGPEGRWVMDYLRDNGIPFIAFRSYVPGCATGAHIHVGLPSSRL